MLYLKLREMEWFRKLDDWAYFYRDILMPLGITVAVCLAIALWITLLLLAAATGILWLTLLAFSWPFPVALFMVIRVNM